MAADETPLISSEAERAQHILGRGVAMFRFAALIWMVALALSGPAFSRPALAWIAVGVAAAWTIYVSIPNLDTGDWTLWVDLGLALGLIVVSGLVVPEGTLGERQLLATGWPVAAVLSWAVAGGTFTGLLSALLLGGGLLLARPVNGIGLTAFDTGDVRAVANGTMVFLLAGGGAGLVSQMLARSAEQFKVVLEDGVRAREQAARAAERESLARAIHDSVLQALALVHKRGRELAQEPSISGAAVGELAEMAGRQEEALRAMILRPPETAPSGTASLRDLLEQVAREVPALPVTVSAVGAIWMPAHPAIEISRAVKQALDNVAAHADARGATVFVDVDLGWVRVTVRDDGKGFVYDEQELIAQRKAGMLRSMKGRIEGLGGRMAVTTAPGTGTEIEFHVPLENWVEQLKR